MFWDGSIYWWYSLLFILGIIFLPLTKRLFGKFFYDFGYPFSKALAIIFITYMMYVLGTVRLLPFSQESLFIVVGGLAILNFYIFSKEKKRDEKNAFSRNKLLFILAEEAVFFIALVFWAYVRGQEPSLHSLEKFMDFGFMNSALRTKYFPPPDMWLAGHSINYYYFGHLAAAVLTKLSAIPSFKTYNLILASIFALGITQTFSLGFNLIYNFLGRSFTRSTIGGVLALLLVNFGGNLHTIYTFTSGYPNENPVPFWKILSYKFNTQTYWYPNATRFIPFTIHEFPIYSYVVADLHGHVFDIPFVILTLAVLLTMFLENGNSLPNKKSLKKFSIFNFQFSIFLGFLSAIHYMTNAFDGFIYLILSAVIFFVIFRFSKRLFINAGTLLLSFVIFILPFSLNFKPFVTGIGVNCAPSFLVAIKKIGPFLFEKGNCQSSPLWMLAILWGFFWMNFIFFVLKTIKDRPIVSKGTKFIFALFAVFTVLIIIPEFFYIKDIYPAHFRANTMFKLGYQAFIMMGVASSFTLIFFTVNVKKNLLSISYFVIFAVFFFFVMIYPYFAITSYYGYLKKTPQLDGSAWMSSQYPEYKEVIDYLNRNVDGQPTILEAQGDSYTDFDIVSSYTGLPTVAGWYVHQWLWRGTPSIVSNITPDIVNIYETDDPEIAKSLLYKYQVKYIIVGPNERQKYKNIQEEKFNSLGRLVFSSTNQQAKIFSVNPVR